MAMIWDEYRRDFERAALKEGRSGEYIARWLAYAERLALARLPIIFDFAHLAALLGFEPSALRHALKNPTALYHTYFVPKRNGGTRRIDEPVDSLKGIQKWIQRQILDQIPPHQAAMGFTSGGSIKLNAAPHLAKPMVLSLDLRDFFSSIRPDKVLTVFQNMGYLREVASALVELTVYREGLPQGAPTSPALSNLVAFGLDQRLWMFAAEEGFKYSRYADDLTFSGRFKPGRVIEACRRLLAEHDLELNENKTRLMLPHKRQEVTGVVVNQRLQAPRTLRRRLRQEIYYIKKYGMDSHEQRSPSLFANRRDHLRGLAEYVLFLNPHDRDARLVVKELGRITYKKDRVDR